MEIVKDGLKITFTGYQFEEVVNDGDFEVRDKAGLVPFFIENLWSESKLILNLSRETDYVVFLKYKKDGVFVDDVIGTVVPDVITQGLPFPVKNTTDFRIIKTDDVDAIGWPLGFKYINGKLKFTYVGALTKDFFEDITLEKYELVDFKDFPVEEIPLVFNADDSIDIVLEKDFIYIIKFITGGEEYSTTPYIYGKPTFYFSSVDRLSRKIKEKGLEYIGEEFDLKLAIWDLSTLVYGITGLTDLPEKLKPTEKQMLEHYIETSIAYELLKSNLNEITFDDEKFKEHSVMTSVTVTDYSNSTLGSTPYEILIKGLKEYKSDLALADDMIKRKFYNRLSGVIATQPTFKTNVDKFRPSGFNRR